MVATKPRRDDDEVRALALGSLEAFIHLVHPQRVIGSVHKELINWWTRDGAKSHQLTLLPRDHQKSAMVAYRVAWEITKNPALRVLYISSTANLAEKQLKFIKDILVSDIYRRYWPEMVNVDEGRREKWTTSEISVDHPLRKAEIVRDPTIFTAGLTTTITGLHCDISVLDDCVTYENAYTEEGRVRVKAQYSLLSSIEGSDGREWVVGTRYHLKDLYSNLLTMDVDSYDKNGEITGSYSLYEAFERQVEDSGDGTGQFLWPRQQRYDGKWFGFNTEILAKKRAQYLDRTQFRAQYYNDPNDPSEAVIDPTLFQYYNTSYLKRQDGYWYYRDRRLNVYAAVDFAFSLARRADYTSIVVVGIDSDRNYYVMDIDRFKTDKISDYYSHILRLHQKWDFRKVRAEVTAAQQVIVRDLKTNYIQRDGLAITIDEYRPTRHEGNKEERVEAILQPRYQNKQMWHYMGGNCQILEEELVLKNPAHDDVKDCLASCVDICVAPTASNRNHTNNIVQITHARFGGIR
jgi:hypothetical protein